VTLPYKQAVIPCLDDWDESALKINAVNTIKNENGRLIGYNTDIYGFRNSIYKKLQFVEQKNCLILGTGGASQAVEFCMKELGFNCRFVSRSSKELNYTNISVSDVENSPVIINTTPLGMFPITDAYPNIPYQAISNKHLVYDLIYNPEKTLFLKKAEAQKASILNGLNMLKLQADKSWKIWNSY